MEKLTPGQDLFNDLYMFNDQPAICPICGARSDIILDMSHTIDKTEVHRCNSAKCQHEFVMVFDEEFERLGFSYSKLV